MNKALILSIAMVICSCHQMYAQTIDDSTLKVQVRTNYDLPLSGVVVSIDSYDEKTSNSHGSFLIQAFDFKERPKVITAKKDNYELSTWALNHNVLTIFMRKATMRTIKGLLVDLNDIPMPNTSIIFHGLPQQNITSDNQGRYTLITPISTFFEPEGLFEINGKKASIKSIDQDGNSVILNLKHLDATYIIYTVNIYETDKTPYTNQVVTVGGESYLTDMKGEFRMSSFKNPNTAWGFNDRKPINIDTLKESNKIIVILAPKPKVISPLINRTDSISPTIGQEILEGMDLLSSFYLKEEEILREHKSKIEEISLKLPSWTDVNEDEKTLLNTQMNQLNETVEHTTRAFEETKAVHKEFILQLQQKLIEKELVIQEIEEQKEELVTSNRINIQLFLTVLAITLIILGIVTWIMRKFKAQNKIIERTKRDLVKAQELAKIGNMVYDVSTNRFTYSDNFLNTLQITNPAIISKLKEQTDGTLHKDMIAEEDRNSVIKKWEEGIKDKSTINIEFRSNSESDRQVFIDMTTEFETNASKKIKGITSTLQDVSSKKENEFRLMAAIQEAKAANKIKEDFLAAMSHEIRTPLNAIIGLTNRLISENPTKKQAENLKIIHVSSEHLLALLNDVLDFSKIQAGKVQLEHREFHLSEVITSTAHSMMYGAQTKGIELVLSLDEKLPEFVKSDKLRINQVIINLLSNAIKFTNKGSIVVSITPQPSNDNLRMVKFSIKDTGIGIPAEKFDTIFESFEQESSATSRKYGGTGLGLSISKNLVELLGGQLKVKSKLGVGTEFYFSIPLEQAHTSLPEIKEINPTRDLSGVKILCVEDNEINQIVAAQYFTLLKLTVTFANTGQEAVDLMTNQSFDLVLMDIRLPDMTGYEVSKKIKADFPDYNTPIIAFTAEFNFSIAAKFKESGMIDFISKPFKEKDLYDTIVKYVDVT